MIHFLPRPSCHLLLLLACTLTISFSANSPAAELPRVTPEQAGFDSERLAQIASVVEQEIENGKLPGCVVCIGRQGQIAFLKAYGHRQLQPEALPMTVDTVFDLASLTKPVATATSIMILVERGVLRLNDRVSLHLPEFTGQGKEEITIQDLLTHVGGLLPDNALDDYQQGRDEAMARINALDLRAEPGEKFIYSDVGFIVLAEVVRAKTGLPIDRFAAANIFQPVGMSETGYLPAEGLRERAATTEQREGRWMRGEVHDPRAYLMGGVAGHAGLFSTAADLSQYASMMLAGGQVENKQILSPRTIQVMTEAYEVSSGLRGLGWDKQTGYSSNRGELMSSTAFGHGGFTGTAIWVDPELDLFVIFLSNRVHPDGKGYVNPLAGRIGSIAVSAIRNLPSVPTPTSAPQSAAQAPPAVVSLTLKASTTQTGIDVLQASQFAPLNGLRIGLITNHTGINQQGTSTVEVLYQAPQVQLKALFSPEHGFAGQLDQAIVADDQDSQTGLKIYSLYGETRRPTPEMLADLDALVFDIQDIGARFYTYISTMGEAMMAAADHKLKFFVLDRPNPINGVDVAGPVLDAGRESFVGFHTIAVRHGMTVGELAKMLRSELSIDVDLQVVPLKNWQREQYFESTGLLWVNPSPNMRSLTEAILYPGIGLLETTNLSVGRGTDTPFEVIGAPWIDAQGLANELNHQRLPGVAFIPIHFRPDSSKYANEMCAGVHISITDRSEFQPLRTGFEIAVALRKLHAENWDIDGYDRLLGDAQVLEAVRVGETVDQIMQRYRAELEDFRQRREQFLLYR